MTSFVRGFCAFAPNDWNFYRVIIMIMYQILQVSFQPLWLIFLTVYPKCIYVRMPTFLNYSR